MTENRIQLSERPLDYFFVATLGFFCCTSLLVDLPHILKLTSGINIELLTGLTASYTEAVDPLMQASPPFLLVAVFLSGLVWGPSYIYFVYGFIYGRNEIRSWALVYGGAMSVTMLMIIAEEFYSPIAAWRVRDESTFLILNLPYLIVPLLLLFRMRKTKPFSV